MATNKKQVEDASNSVDSNSKLEAIKNLIFGENIQQYDSEFDLLKKDILAKRKELFEMIEDTREEVNKSIDSLSTDLNIRITDLESKIDDRLDNMEDDKTSRSILGEALIELGQKIKA